MTTKNDTRRDEILEAIRDGVERIKQERDNRQASNEEIGAIRAKLETLGIPRKALGAAIQYMDLDPDNRKGFDIAYRICREALGEPVDAQTDIIDYLEEIETKEREEKERAASAPTAANPNPRAAEEEREAMEERREAAEEKATT